MTVPTRVPTPVRRLAERLRTVRHRTPEPGASRRRSRAVVVATLAAAVVLGGGAAAYGQVHKSVTLDVDGSARTVSTFSGSVERLLAEQDVPVRTQDLVSPQGALTDGAQVVVRHARQLTLDSGAGVETTVWTTAPSADEALDMLSRRAGQVTLVASRSAEGGRPQLGLAVALHGAADVVVDGRTVTVPAAGATVGDLLDGLGVVLGDRDRVLVRTGAQGRVTVVVSRVSVHDVTTVSAVPFETTTRPDPGLATGQRRVLTPGTAGERTLVERVTTVDGTETARVALSDTQSREPVTAVVAIGTAPRPAPARPATVAAVPTADGLNWAALARCESGGNPAAVSANGLYYGLYQFSLSTWGSVGGSGLPSQASPADQTARAQALYARSGAGQWPVCGKQLFG